MDQNQKKQIYAALAAPFSEACVQRTDAKQTGKGYSTTGIGYQFIVNRLNDVLGVGGFRVHRDVKVTEVQRSNGRPAFEAICELTLELGEWVNGNFVTFAESIADGGHIASGRADAVKGCYTNAFKKAAAFHGVGRQAYEGTLDDDNLPDEVTPADTQHANAQPKVAPVQPPPTPTGYVRTGPVIETTAQQPERNRLSSRQLSAVHSISRKLGIDPAALRARVKAQYGAQLEFVSKSQASEIIKLLDAQLNGNGSGNHEQSEALS